MQDKSNKRKILNISGLLLLIAIFVIPVTYSPFNRDASAEISYHPEQTDDYNLAKIIHRQKIRSIDSFLQAHHKRFNFQGNVLVAYKGDKIYEGSFGCSNPRKNDSLEKDAVFQLASVSKQFTAVAALKAIEKGLFQYQDSVTRFFPNFPYEGVTVRMLLNHTAGLPNYMWLLEHYWQGERIPDNTDVMRLLAKHKLNLHFRPGTRFGYSNTGYVVLASIIEKASGMRFNQYMQQEIFKPLEMDKSFVKSAAYPAEDKEHLDGYKYWGHRYRKVPATVNDGAVGDKGIYSTIEDLYKWDQALYENKLVSAQTMKKAYEPLKLKNGNTYPYGYGFRLKEVDGEKVAYHYGKWNGFRTGIIRYIEDTSTIIILGHTDRPYNSRITGNIQALLQQEKNENGMPQEDNTQMAAGNPG